MTVAKASNGSVLASVTVKRTDIDAVSAKPAAEIVQLYLSGAVVPGLTTPRHNLVGFQRVELAAGASAVVSMEVVAHSLETAMEDGTRIAVRGQYKLSAGGHQPGDAEGDAGSSGACMTVTITL